MNTCRLEVVGCGIVNHYVIEALFTNPYVASHVRAIDTFDAKQVSSIPILPPWFRGHEGEPKATCLRKRALALLNRPAAGAAYHRYVENIDWKSLWTCDPESEVNFIFVLMGLDSWPSRVSAMSDIRRAAGEVSAEVLIILAAVEQGQAQVSVFGNSREDDPCVVCGLLALPASEPCIVLREGGGLLRGDLHSEAAAAAMQVRTVISNCLSAGNSEQWRNTKINLLSQSDSGQYTTIVRKRTKAQNCWGPHAADAPFSPEMLLSD